jgi:uncharacterized delta-60 repeat protein
MLGRMRAGLATMAVIAAGPCLDAHAAAGDLDASFSQDGKVSLLSAGSFVARAVAVQPDGRILVGGYSCVPGPSTSGVCQADGDSSFRIARFTADGGLDPEWGEGGLVTTPVGSGRSQIFDLLVQPGGRVVAAGVARHGDRDSFALAGYDARGALDPGFDGDGMAFTPVGSGFSAVADLAPGPSGTIVAAGQAYDAGGRSRIAVTRYSADGQLDGGFGMALTGAKGYGYGLGAWVAPDGGVIAAGIAGASAEDAASYRTGVARLLPEGGPDGGFSGDGAADFSPGSSSSFANAVTGLPDGRWLTAGAATDGEGRQVMALLRGDARGALDPSWGDEGIALVRTLSGAVAADLVRMQDGRVIAAGHAATGTGEYHFALARLDDAGQLDETFGDGGVVTAGWERFPVARGTALTLDAAGRPLVTGIGCDGGSGPQCEGGTAYLALARFTADPSGNELRTPPLAPSADRRAPAVTLSTLPRAMRRRTLLRRGLFVRLRADEASAVNVTLRARRGRRTVTLADRTLTVATGRRALRMRISRRRMPRSRFTLRVSVRVSDTSGNIVTVHRNIRIR